VEEKYNFPLAGVKRATLQSELVNAAINRGIPFHFSKQLTHIDEDAENGLVTAKFRYSINYIFFFLLQLSCPSHHFTL
jgi:hypothetical protein